MPKSTSPYEVSPRQPLHKRSSPAFQNSNTVGQQRNENSSRKDTDTSQSKLPADYGGESSMTSILFIAFVFALSVVTLFLIYLNSPELNEDEKQYVTLPKNIDDAKNLGKVLSHYKEMYFFQVFGGFFITYIFLQSFAIPGSIFLSILSGFLFPFPVALFTVCLCSGIGASFCYLISYLVGRPLVKRYIPDKAQKLSVHVHRHKSNLLWYIIFLRITPFLPNWFINITSPVINVPLFPFFLGTFLGVAPPSFVAVQAGKTLYKLTSSSDAISFNSLLLLAVFALLSLLPVIFKEKLRKKFD